MRNDCFNFNLFEESAQSFFSGLINAGAVEIAFGCPYSGLLVLDGVNRLICNNLDFFFQLSESYFDLESSSKNLNSSNQNSSDFEVEKNKSFKFNPFHLNFKFDQLEKKTINRSNRNNTNIIGKFNLHNKNLNDQYNVDSVNINKDDFFKNSLNDDNQPILNKDLDFSSNTRFNTEFSQSNWFNTSNRNFNKNSSFQQNTTNFNYNMDSHDFLNQNNSFNLNKDLNFDPNDRFSTEFSQSNWFNASNRNFNKNSSFQQNTTNFNYNMDSHDFLNQNNSFNLNKDLNFDSNTCFNTKFSQSNNFNVNKNKDNTLNTYSLDKKSLEPFFKIKKIWMERSAEQFSKSDYSEIENKQMYQVLKNFSYRAFLTKDKKEDFDQWYNEYKNNKPIFNLRSFRNQDKTRFRSIRDTFKKRAKRLKEQELPESDSFVKSFNNWIKCDKYYNKEYNETENKKLYNFVKKIAKMYDYLNAKKKL